MRILITGITGMVGSHLAEYALRQHPGVEVHGLVRWRSPLVNLRGCLDRLRLHEAELRDLHSLVRLLEAVRPDWIFHLAAQSYVSASFLAPADTMHTNVIGNTNPTADPGVGIDGITQYAGPSAVSFQSQNGFGAGQLLSLEFSEEGLVTGVFDNGQSRPLFQIALASFIAPDALLPLGNGLFRESVESGSPAIGVPKSGGLGTVVGGAVEVSNVSLAQEFIDLISLQRSFQANARVITSSDQLLNDLINLVR